MANDILSNIWPEWKIIKQIGRGSYGVVYEAVRTDHSVESRAAIKVISIPKNESEIDFLCSEGVSKDGTLTYLQGVVRDFVSEIQLMESFKGVQNIVSVEDYKVVEKTNEIGWYIYIRMELLIPFNSYICNKTLSEKDVINLGVDICSALELCTKRNVIHRDIKPQNIFINQFGDFKLGDFGIARKLENLTGGLSQKGSPNYMAPEVVKSTQYDATIDLYSLGIVLYQLMNKNHLPFLNTEHQLLNPNERTAALNRRLAGEPLPAPCDASPAMAHVILCACSPDPSKRFTSATLMKNALISVANGTYAGKEETLNKTMSIHYPTQAQDLNRTISVRKPPHAQKTAQKIVDTFDGKKRFRLPIIIAIVLVIIALGSTAGVIINHYALNTKNGTIESDTETLTALADTSEDESAIVLEDTSTDKFMDETTVETATSPTFDFTVDFERKIDLLGREYAIVTGISKQGEKVWTYITSSYQQTELDRINDIGTRDGMYYLIENGTIRVLNVADGTVLWSNSEFGGSAYDSAFGDDGTLYLCGYYGPDLFIVDDNGNTIKSIASLNTDYYWPYQINYLGTHVAITFAGTPFGEDEVVYVNLSDYSTSITEEVSASQETIAAQTNIKKQQAAMLSVSDIYATSYLIEDQYDLIHVPSNIIDGNNATAWVENVSGQGEGESITIELNDTYIVSGFIINAGYQKNTSIYEKNSRPSKLTVIFSDGSCINVTLEDYYGQQKITFNSSIETSSVTFTIESVYPGSKYEDTAISEISLF